MIPDQKIKKDMISLFFYKIIRIWDVTYWFLMSLSGYLLAVTAFSIDTYAFSFMVFVISTFAIASFTFAINNFYDIDSDRQNPRRRLLNAFATGEISEKTGILLLFLLFIIPLLVCSLLKNITILLFCLLLLFMGWVYSAPPLRIKSRPVFDIIWHFFEFFLLVYWGSLLAGYADSLIWLVATSAGLFSCVFQVTNHISDFTFDKESGTNTFAVWAGLDTAQTTAKLLMVIHLLVLLPVILLYSLRYPASLVMLIVGIGFSIYESRPKNTNQKTQWSLQSFLFYVSLTVYISCLLYRLCAIVGLSPLFAPPLGI